MKKFFLSLAFAMFFISCSTLAQFEQTTNDAEIERLVLPDSTSIYFINWRGHIYIYSPSQHNIREIYPIK